MHFENIEFRLESY